MDKAELLHIVDRMSEVVNLFYAMARKCDNHAFVEFTGLMNEYIKMCRNSAEQGIDFTLASKHTGIAIAAAPYNIRYLLEKLECIYGPAVAKVLREKLLLECQPAEKPQEGSVDIVDPGKSAVSALWQ